MATRVCALRIRWHAYSGPSSSRRRFAERIDADAPFRIELFEEDVRGLDGYGPPCLPRGAIFRLIRRWLVYWRWYESAAWAGWVRAWLVGIAERSARVVKKQRISSST